MTSFAKKMASSKKTDTAFILHSDTGKARSHSIYSHARQAVQRARKKRAVEALRPSRPLPVKHFQPSPSIPNSSSKSGFKTGLEASTLETVVPTSGSAMELSYNNGPSWSSTAYLGYSAYIDGASMGQELPVVASQAVEVQTHLLHSDGTEQGMWWQNVCDLGNGNILSDEDMSFGCHGPLWDACLQGYSDSRCVSSSDCMTEFAIFSECGWTMDSSESWAQATLARPAAEGP